MLLQVSCSGFRGDSLSSVKGATSNFSVGCQGHVQADCCAWLAQCARAGNEGAEAGGNKTLSKLDAIMKQVGGLIPEEDGQFSPGLFEMIC